MNARDLVASSWTGTQVVGHRGAAAYRPENTLESFREAIACGAPAVECDVHVSRDGSLMVIHDPTLDRTTSLSGPVALSESATMRKAGVPTLQEYLEVLQGKAVAVIELKDGEGLVAKSIEAIRDRSMVEQTILFSFDRKLLAEAIAAEPDVYTVWLVGSPASVDEVRRVRHDLGADAIGADYPHVTAEAVRALHEDRCPVFAWTVPPGEEVERLRAIGTNFIITNHPRDVLDQLRSDEPISLTIDASDERRTRSIDY